MVVNGKRYASMKEYCVEQEVNYNSFCRYMSMYDMTPQEVVEHMKKAQKMKDLRITERIRKPRYTVNGKEYYTLKEIATEYGISIPLVRSRLASGEDMDAPVLHGRHGNLLYIGDYVFNSAREAGLHFGITHVTVSKICKRVQDVKERYECCLDWCCKAHRTSRNIDPS